MRKEEILKKLKELDLDKEKYIIISGASLVVQGIIDETPDIDLATSKEYFDKISWKKQINPVGVTLKVHDCFEISDNFFIKDRFVVINGYKFMLLEDVLHLKELLNREKDKETIKILRDTLSKE